MRRLKNFLPIVLIALAVQIFAPIGACWAASIAASDPLAGAVICHGDGAPGAGQTDQTGHRAHDEPTECSCRWSKVTPSWASHAKTKCASVQHLVVARLGLAKLPASDSSYVVRHLDSP